MVVTKTVIEVANRVSSLTLTKKAGLLGSLISGSLAVRAASSDLVPTSSAFSSSSAAESLIVLWFSDVSLKCGF